ncbi:MAG TPA: hypothetical protein VEI73_17365 [Candidatus Acidoferrum sp.]|nr:hypothetical protein [Candidatus Acidoferrum sp.]
MSYVQRRKFLGAVLFALMALLAVAANATTLARMRFGELAHQATAVARLRCVGTQSFWEHGEIWTETRFAVVEQSKGSLPEFIRVRTIGGIVGNLHSRVEEVPTFRVGEEAYVFLWGRDGEPFRVLGWSQGTFRIRRDPRTGLETVTQDSAAVPVFDPGTRQFRHGGVRNLPLAVFQLKLERALEGERKQGQ